MIRLPRPIAAIALGLALASCGGDKAATGDAPPEGQPIAAIPAPAGTAWRDTVTTTADGGTLVGNPAAPIKLIEYGSLTCPTCARFGAEGFEPLMDRYVNSGVVSFELRNFAVHGTVDIVLARLARCGEKEAVVPLSEQVWTNFEQIMGPVQANAAQLEQAMSLPMEQRFVGFAQAAGFYDFFAQRGISTDQARSCLADVKAMEELANLSQRYGTEFNVSGTPTFELNGARIAVNTWAALEPYLQRAGAR